MDPLEQVGDSSKGQYGVLKIQTSPLGTETASGSTELAGKDKINSTKHFFYKYISNSLNSCVGFYTL